VKWHFKTKQGIKNFFREEAGAMEGQDPDYSQRDLFHAIKDGNFPKWRVCLQIMPEKDAETYHINPFDLTKVWPHKDYPLVEVGELELNRNPENYFADVGVNYDTIPVNKPQCPFATYNRDGHMRVDGNYGSAPNYEPNSFGGPTQNPAYIERPRPITGTIERHNHRLENDYYSQPGNLFSLLPDDAKQRLIGNICVSMSTVPRRVHELQIQHFYKADPAYGTGVAKGLGLNIDQIIAAGKAKEVAAD
jgi:catalase